MTLPIERNKILYLEKYFSVIGKLYIINICIKFCSKYYPINFLFWTCLNLNNFKNIF